MGMGRRGLWGEGRVQSLAVPGLVGGLAGALRALRDKRRDAASTLGLAVLGMVGGRVGALRAQREL